MGPTINNMKSAKNGVDFFVNTRRKNINMLPLDGMRQYSGYHNKGSPQHSFEEQIWFDQNIVDTKVLNWFYQYSWQQSFILILSIYLHFGA